MKVWRTGWKLMIMTSKLELLQPSLLLIHVSLLSCSLSLPLSPRCSDEEDDEYSDDDDVSWKVRRASAKCLTVILGSRVEMLADFYQTISPALISRFKGQLLQEGDFPSHYNN